MARFDFLVRQGERVLHSTVRAEMLDLAAVWHRIDELADQYCTSGVRIIVRDANGETVISMGVLTIQRMRGVEAA